MYLCTPHSLAVLQRKATEKSHFSFFILFMAFLYANISTAQRQETIHVGQGETLLSFAHHISEESTDIVKTGEGRWIIDKKTNINKKNRAKVQNGELQVNGLWGDQACQQSSGGIVSGSSRLEIGSNARLSGRGRIQTHETTIGGQHAPGTSPGIQTFASDLSYTDGSSIEWELIANATTGRGTNFDGIDLTSGADLSFSGTVTLSLVLNGPGSTVDWTNALWDANITGTDGWLLFSGIDTLSGFENLVLSADSIYDSTGAALAAVKGHRNGFLLFYDEENGDIYLNYRTDLCNVSPIYGTGYLSGGTGRDSNWALVTLPKGYDPGQPVPYAPYVISSGLPGIFAAPSGFTSGSTTYYWVAPKPDATSLFTNISEYNWILEQEFSVEHGGFYDFTFAGAGDNSIEFWVNGVIDSTTNPIKPTIFGGTQIGYRWPTFSFIGTLTGRAYLNPGINKAYMVMFDFGGLTTALISNAAFTCSDYQDADGDGVEDHLDSAPSDPCVPVQLAGYKGYHPTHPVWSADDCDEDGLTNGDDNNRGLDPYDPDTDGDGVLDGKEVEEGTDPNDRCSYNPASQTLTPDASWAAADCDGDGEANGTDPKPLNRCKFSLGHTPTPGGPVCEGRIGNRVWDDRNHNGLQDVGEPGLDSVSITLLWAGEDGDFTTTADNISQTILSGPDGGFDPGEYSFVIEDTGKFRLTFVTPAGYVPTLLHQGDQTYGGLLDSDGRASALYVGISVEEFTVVSLNELVTNENAPGDNIQSFPDENYDETHDAGFWFPCCSDLLQYCCPGGGK